MTDEVGMSDEELRELLPRLRRFALALTRDPTTADDLVQSCLERALSKWRTRRASGNTQAWLFAILYRQFIDGRRRSQRFRHLLGWLADEPQVGGSTEDLAMARAALDMFGDLAADQRALLLLIVVEGMSYREAAQLLEVPIGTVMSRLARARQRLRAMVEGEPERPRLRVMK
jgi:RNA polymerase sigma-70 factor (ECF subfamily)